MKKNLLFKSITLSLSAYLSLFPSTVSAATAVLYPTADGTYKQWATSPLLQPNHYSLVDETSCNGTTDYVLTNTIGKRDSYSISLSSIPNGSTITSIEIQPCASANGSLGTANFNVFYRLNGVDSANAGNYFSSSTTPIDRTGTTFSGLSIVKGATTALETGIVYTGWTGGSNPGVRLSKMKVTITY